MKKIISLVMAVVIFLGLFTGYKVVYAAASDLSDYEKEIINAYLYTIMIGQANGLDHIHMKGLSMTL